jgi:hypothetical protein
MFGKEPMKDPRLRDEELMNRIDNEQPKKKVRLLDGVNGSNVDPEVSFERIIIIHE